MMIVRRLIVLAMLFFWQGGFLFYSSIVVPAGRKVLGSDRDQGFVTRRVTDRLNMAGAIALPALAWDAAAVRSRRRSRWACWLGMAFTLIALGWLHVRLDALLDPDAFRVLDRSTFYIEHRWYLWTSTVQFGCAVTYLVLAVMGWREEDQGNASSRSPEARG